MTATEVWAKFMVEAQFFFQRDETLESFQVRMEKAGYSLDFQEPGTCKDLSDIEFVRQVISYLNAAAGTSFRIKLQSANATVILNRRREKYSIDDFKLVIDKKTKEWKGTMMEAQLKPEVLFDRKHFDNYLGQKNAHVHATIAPKTGYEQLNESVERAKGRVSGLRTGSDRGKVDRRDLR